MSQMREADGRTGDNVLQLVVKGLVGKGDVIYFIFDSLKAFCECEFGERYQVILAGECCCGGSTDDFGDNVLTPLDVPGEVSNPVTGRPKARSFSFTAHLKRHTVPSTTTSNDFRLRHLCKNGRSSSSSITRLSGISVFLPESRLTIASTCPRSVDLMRASNLNQFSSVRHCRHIPQRWQPSRDLQLNISRTTLWRASTQKSPSAKLTPPTS